MYYFHDESPSGREENSAYLTRLSLLLDNLDELWGDLDVIEDIKLTNFVAS